MLLPNVVRAKLISPEEYTRYANDAEQRKRYAGGTISPENKLEILVQGDLWMSSGVSIRGARDPEEIHDFIKRILGPDPEQQDEHRSG